MSFLWLLPLASHWQLNVGWKCVLVSSLHLCFSTVYHQPSSHQTTLHRLSITFWLWQRFWQNSNIQTEIPFWFAPPSPHLCMLLCMCVWACPCFCYLSSTKILMLLAKWEHFCKVGPFCPVTTNSEDWGFRSVRDRVIVGTFVARGASSVMCNLYESPHKGRNASMCVYICVYERERQHSGPHQFLCRAECEGLPSPYFWEEVGSEMLLKPECCHCW